MKKFLILSMLFLVGLTACNFTQGNGNESPTATVAPVDALRTSAAKTVDALSTALASNKPATPTPTVQGTVPVIKTQTLPVKTSIPSQTLPPSLTPLASLTKAPCDMVASVKDITAADGTFFYPNTTFTKTWELKNGGSCTWTSQYALVFFEGEKMGAAVTLPLVDGSKTVAPTQSVQISVQMTAPASTGKKTGYWKLKNPSGGTFGVGAGGTKPFWIEINVASSFTLINNLCSAEWNNAGETLACPGRVWDAKGSVTSVDKPKFAGGYEENEPSILMLPQSSNDGMIVGKFPPMLIPAKAAFQTLVVCAFEAPKCSAKVILTAQEGSGAEKTLLDVTKTADNGTSPLKIDLVGPGLVGKSVIFRLYVKANGSATDDKIYWVNPHLVIVP